MSRASPAPSSIRSNIWRRGGGMASSSSISLAALGKVAYHAACHQRVQAFGQRTREFLSLIPDTEVTLIERCSGHDGTYAVKEETHAKAMKIARPVVRRVRDSGAEVYGSDCPMAGRMIAHGLDDGSSALHPVSMLRRAYGI